MGNFFKKLAILNVIHKDRKGLEYRDIARELAILDEELIKQLVIELYEKHYIVTATQGWRLTGATDMYIELVLKPIVVPVVVSIMTATIMIVLFG